MCFPELENYQVLNISTVFEVLCFTALLFSFYAALLHSTTLKREMLLFYVTATVMKINILLRNPPTNISILL